MAKVGGRLFRERNTLVFERLLGRYNAAPLLGVRQVIATGEGQNRAIVRARYDVLDDYTLLQRERGSVSCVPDAPKEDHKHAPAAVVSPPPAGRQPFLNPMRVGL